MADGKTHAKSTKKIATATTLIGAALAVAYHPILIAVPLGAWFGHLATPDLDHHWTTYDEMRILRWNRFIGRLWILYWQPYQKLSSHRGLSHSYPAGTVIRLLYLLWLPVLLSFQLPDPFWPAVSLFWILLYCGWSLPDLDHAIKDKLQYKLRK